MEADHYIDEAVQSLTEAIHRFRAKDMEFMDQALVAAEQFIAAARQRAGLRCWMSPPKNMTDLRRAFAAAEKLSNFDFGIGVSGYDERVLIDAEGEHVCTCPDPLTAKALADIIDAAYDVADGPNMDEIRKEAARGRGETP